MKLTFIGATETVTGSKYLIQHQGLKILIDCGLFQGFKELRERNWAPFPFDPKDIDVVLLTHAHIDHSGCIPLLVKRGFAGKVYCSEATLELCKILLPDSGFLQEEDARRANKYGYSRHKPALPLYTKDEAESALEYFETHGFGVPFDLGHNLKFTFSRSGHILGSSFITLTDGDKTLIFSGDLGRSNDPIMKSPAHLEYTDYLVLESTYGDKLHDQTEQEIGEVIRKTAGRGGSIVIPAFAVGRAQLVLYYIEKLKSKKLIPDIPVYLDSPMAVNTTKLLCQFMNEHKLPESQCELVSTVATYVQTVEDSKALDASPLPKIIISASGMATGGRVVHHLKHYMTDPKNTLMFTGFQAAGTRGDRIVRQEESIRIFGEDVPLRAEVKNLSS